MDGVRLLALAVLSQAMDDATQATPTIKAPAWAIRRYDAQAWLWGDDPWLLFWLECAGLTGERIRNRLAALLDHDDASQRAMGSYFREGVLV